jgi:hypothetical protein
MWKPNIFKSQHDWVINGFDLNSHWCSAYSSVFSPAMCQLHRIGTSAASAAMGPEFYSLLCISSSVSQSPFFCVLYLLFVFNLITYDKIHVLGRWIIQLILAHKWIHITTTRIRIQIIPSPPTLSLCSPFWYKLPFSSPCYFLALETIINLFFFFFWWDWGLNSRLYTCKAGTLL